MRFFFALLSFSAAAKSCGTPPAEDDLTVSAWGPLTRVGAR